jgi:hypothetical protein
MKGIRQEGVVKFLGSGQGRNWAVEYCLLCVFVHIFTFWIYEGCP